MDVDLPGLRSGAVRGHWLGSVVVATRSGFYLPGDAGPVAAGDAGRAAADWFPEVAGATVVHVHADLGSGGFRVGGEVLSAQQFHDRVLVPLGLVSQGLLILVACGTALLGGMLAWRGQRPVLAPDADVFTTTDGRLLAARLEVDGEGRSALSLQNWMLFAAGRAQSVALGADLRAALDRLGDRRPGDPLGADEVPRVTGEPGPLPDREVKWTGPRRTGGGAGQHQVGAAPDPQMPPDGGLIGTAPWLDLSLTLATRQVTYGRTTLTLPVPGQATLLAALLDGGRHTPDDLAARWDGATLTALDVQGLQAVLESLPGFRGEITVPHPNARWYQLALPPALPDTGPLGGGQFGAGPLFWHGVELRPTGELVYNGSAVTLTSRDQVDVLATLMRFSDRPVTPGQLVTGGQTQRGIRETATQSLPALLRGLPGFPGQVRTIGTGFRLQLSGSVTRHGLSVDQEHNTVSYGGTSVDVLSIEADVLAELLLADGQVRTAREIGLAVGRKEKAIRANVRRLRQVLADLPEFPGRILASVGQGFQLLPQFEQVENPVSQYTLAPWQLPGAVPDSGPDVPPGAVLPGPPVPRLPALSAFASAEPATWHGLHVIPDSEIAEYQGSAVTLSPVQARALAALIRAPEQFATSSYLAKRASSEPSAISPVMAGLRTVLGSLPGFRGEIIITMLPEPGIRLALSAALSDGPDADGTLTWEDGAIAHRATGRLSYDGHNGALPAQDQADLLAALIRAAGQPVTPGQLVTDRSPTQNAVRAVADRLQRTLEDQLPWFPGRVITADSGYRLARTATVTWNGLALNRETGHLSYGDTTTNLPTGQAEVLATLMSAKDQLVTFQELGKATGLTEQEIRYANRRLRKALGSLPGFDGEIFTQGRSGFRLRLKGAAAAGQVAWAEPATRQTVEQPRASRPTWRSLADHGERLEPMPPDGFCLASALLTAAREGFALEGITTPQQLHEELADYLNGLPDWGALTEQARVVWITEQARASSGPLYQEFYRYSLTERGAQMMRAELTAQVRRAGIWNSAGFDLVLGLAVRRFPLRVTIVYDDGGRHRLDGDDVPVTDDEVPVTLVRSLG